MEHLWHRSAVVPAAPAQDGVDPQQQLLRLERLDQIVVGPGLQPSIRFGVSPLAVSSRIGVCIRLRRSRVSDAILARHHHVQHDQVELQPASSRRACAASRATMTRKPLRIRNFCNSPRMRSSSSTISRCASGDRSCRPSFRRIVGCAHFRVHHRLQHLPEARHRLRPRRAIGRPHPRPLRVAQLAFQRGVPCRSGTGAVRASLPFSLRPARPRSACATPGSAIALSHQGSTAGSTPSSPAAVDEMDRPVMRAAVIHGFQNAVGSAVKPR
jgi:hypothetical protein